MSLEAFGDEGEAATDGYVPEERVDEGFKAGLQAMREMLARFVEQGGNTEVATSLRLNWHPAWGKDPGRPERVALSAWD